MVKISKEKLKNEKFKAYNEGFESGFEEGKKEGMQNLLSMLLKAFQGD